MSDNTKPRKSGDGDLYHPPGMSNMKADGMSCDLKMFWSVREGTGAAKKTTAEYCLDCEPTVAGLPTNLPVIHESEPRTSDLGEHPAKKARVDSDEFDDYSDMPALIGRDSVPVYFD